ncbi:LacI family DNA-binding transcriptional regulator [Inquilinus sp. CA228]|uniref:LacI family DNA-binding transcriptional regulator n=1 Tax=Inquilinus sp. CA228 TaxID=3455609 RepID=UPI003F8D2538
MADVAREAGVSPSTASRVLHSSGYASAENRQRVLLAAEKVGYRPNMQARGLRTQRSYTLGISLDSATSNPYFTNVAHAVRTQAAAAGFSLLTVDHEFDSAVERDGLRHFLDHSVEAVIVCHPFDAGNFAFVKDAGVPIIQIERDVIVGAHCVAIDPEPGFERALEHLLQLNHRRIGYVGGHRSTQASPQRGKSVEDRRVHAFRTFGGAMGLDPAQCPVFVIPYDSDISGGTLSGYQFAQQLLRERDCPTALVVGSDVLAAGILQAAHDFGISVPQDLSIIGYDDSIAKLLSPPLTTIAHPYREIASGVLNILEMTAAGPSRPLRRVVRSEFKLGRSTQAI